MSSVFPSDFRLNPPPRSLYFRRSPQSSSSSTSSTSSSYQGSTSVSSSLDFRTYSMSSPLPSLNQINRTLLSSTELHLQASPYHNELFVEVSTLQLANSPYHEDSSGQVPSLQLANSQFCNGSSNRFLISQLLFQQQCNNFSAEVLTPQSPRNFTVLFKNRQQGSSPRCNDFPNRFPTHRVNKYPFRKCVFCKSNGEQFSFYASHSLKDKDGNVTCPILFKYECPTCKATGKHAHTKAYCPISPQIPFKRWRNSFEQVSTLQLANSPYHEDSSGQKFNRTQSTRNFPVLFKNRQQGFSLRSNDFPNRFPTHRVNKYPFRKFSSEVCVFCKSNREQFSFYASHSLKDKDGNVTCPILFKYECPTCKATGKHAHTKAYCPISPQIPFRRWRK